MFVLENLATILGSVIVIVTIILSYFIPTIIAIIRKHKDVLAIFVLNLLAGWTFIGWIISIVWACKK